ncbi:MAG: hypothetical protein AAF703_09495 [Cyanobacteria bacterium P01_D01_bin.105]
MYKRRVSLSPLFFGNAGTHDNLGVLRRQQNQLSEARAQYRNTMEQ